jgi:DNA polymerase elongation subunit (family B)
MFYNKKMNRDTILQIVKDIETKNINSIKEHIKNEYLVYEDNILKPTKKYIQYFKDEKDDFNRKQQAKKLLLNSTYGALLNEFMLFYDERIGQSVTLTGRNITRHMCSQIAHEIDNKYDYLEKSIVYGDTDSCYFTASHTDNFPNNTNDIIKYYDDVADKVNKTFPSFLKKYFNTPENSCVIKAGRELVGRRGYFIKKKRYGILIIDKEGKRLDTDNSPGKLKAMGLDLKRSDTPVIVQKFLEKTLTNILLGCSENEIMDGIKDFRKEFSKLNPWEKGSPKKVNNLSDYISRYSNSDAKVNLPGHVRASMVYNNLRKLHNDNVSAPITDGAKIIVCKLKPNPMNYNSIAYPIDETRLPAWFKNLPFDDDEMEQTLIDKKIDNLVGVMQEIYKWDISKGKNNDVFDDLFDF